MKYNELHGGHPNSVDKYIFSGELKLLILVF